MSILVSVVLFYTMTNTLLWDLPGDVLAAPASAVCGWKGVNSLSANFITTFLPHKADRPRVGPASAWYGR